jgi:serine phosphatase RsbU (regulator of sigma subunit)
MSRRWGWLSSLTVVVLLLISTVGAWVVHNAVRDQENRLLQERGNEVGLVLKEAVDSLTSQLETLGGVLRATNGSRGAFDRAVAPIEGSGATAPTIAVVHETATGFQVEYVRGALVHAGQTITGAAGAALSLAQTSGVVAPTQVLGAGSDRQIGFAIGPPSTPPGTLVYEQLSLGTLGPPQQAAAEPFNELHVILYASATPTPSQALVTTADQIPLRGDVRSVMVTAGAAKWTLQVSAVDPLVGQPTAYAAWLTLGIGIIIALLLGLVVEGQTRRRRSALALYRNEHELAEALQRSLLPALPTVDDLELAACYLPGSADQQVGGDWYDGFELSDGHVGLAIGDVLGHDIDAAALMSRVQTALRAYALMGEQPGSVLDRLEAVLASLDTERLVTVFYGVLGPVAADGSRELVFANAGHPKPLIRRPSGAVEELLGASSLLLGVSADVTEPRPQHTVTLPAGSTLMLYTDGLVEVPGESFGDRLDALRREVSVHAADLSMSALCDWLLDQVQPEHRRDDVAILVARLPDTTVAQAVTIPETRRRERWGFLRLGSAASSSRV